MRRAALALVIPAASLTGCDELRYDPESPWVEGEMGVIRSGLTVAEAGGCSTGIVRALSEQLIDEINCMRPGTLASFEHPNIQPAAVVFTALQTTARDTLIATVRNGPVMRMNSALRTLPQGYLLYRWWQEGRCNIALAARPGRSRHESGLAIDIDDHAAWRPRLEANSWRWFGNDDQVHFDYVGGGTVDLAGLSVLAFQRLWNRNHRNDLIDEDGLYGPQTEGRLRQSPVEGFPIGACEPDQPMEPEPVEPEPVEPEPVEPEPVEPEPQPAPMPVPEPDPVQPEPQPAPEEPEPAPPEPNAPEPAQPEPAQPEPEPQAPAPEAGEPAPVPPEPEAPIDLDLGVPGPGGADAGITQDPAAPARLVGGCRAR